MRKLCLYYTYAGCPRNFQSALWYSLFEYGIDFSQIIQKLCYEKVCPRILGHCTDRGMLLYHVIYIASKELC